MLCRGDSGRVFFQFVLNLKDNNASTIGYRP